MSFFYCRDDGTATGDGGRYTSEKANNSWDTEFTATTEYYDSIESALTATTPPVNGDVIYVSSASTFDKGSSITLSIATPPSSPVQVFSVDDSAINEYLSGGEDSASASNQDYSIDTVALRLQYNGMVVTVGDDLFTGLRNAGFSFTDSVITLTNFNNKIQIFGDGTVLELMETDIVMSVNTNLQLVQLSKGAMFKMCGGSVSVTSGTLGDFIGNSGSDGGMTALIDGVDLSAFGSGVFLLGDSGSDSSFDSLINMRVQGCKIDASVGFVEEDFASSSHYFLMTNSSSDSDAAEYQFYQRTWAGDVEDQDDSGIHRSESTPFSSGTRVSMMVTTNADCSKGRPLIVDLPTRFAELSSASSDVIRVYFAQPNSQPNLTNANCYAEVYYPDGTTKNLWVNASNRVTDILSAGTEHTDDSGSSVWLDGISDLTSHDEYYMDIDTSGTPGSDGVPTIKLFITEPSATIYFDTTIDLV